MNPQLHVVHYDAERFANASQAQHHAAGLAVLGVLLEVRGPGPPPNPINTILTPLGPPPQKNPSPSRLATNPTLPTTTS